MIIAIVAADVFSPADVHLGPLLIAAPALTASFAGPVLTGVVGMLTVAAMVCIGVFRGVLETQNLQSQIIAVVVISTLVTVFRYVRERRSGELAQVRRVSTAVQQAVLRPLPRRIGPLRVASFYPAAEEQALIGGDLYAAVRTSDGTRLIVGDVMGKGLTAIGDAALPLGAFREAAHRQATLPDLVAYLDHSVCWHLAEPTEPDQAGECFITAAVLDIADEYSVVQMVSRGHPPPLLLRDWQGTTLRATRPAPPLGLGELTSPDCHVDTFALEPTDVLVLYTDGVTEARDARGVFLPAGRAGRLLGVLPTLGAGPPPARPRRRAPHGRRRCDRCPAHPTAGITHRGSRGPVRRSRTHRRRTGVIGRIDKGVRSPLSPDPDRARWDSNAMSRSLLRSAAPMQ